MKKLLCLVLSLLFILSFGVAAAGLEPLAFHVEGFQAENGTLRVYCSTNAPAVPTAGQFTISLGNIPLTVKSVSRLADTGEGVSVIFVADVSGSISGGKLQSIKDTLNTVVDGLGEKDNASVLTVGDNAYTQPFVSDKTQLKEQIAAIKGMSEDTNLYASIVKALEILSTNENCRQKKCLIVLSDGEDYGIKGITREEVNAKIEKLRIPIYTVAMLGEKPAQRYIDTAKILGSFARLSPGGADFTHKLSAASSAEVAGSITASIQNSLVVSADLTGFASQGNEMYLQVSLEVAGQGKASDGYNILTSGLTVEETTSSVPYLPIAGGLVAVILIAVILIFVIKRKKQGPPEAEPQVISDESPTGEWTEVELPETTAQEKTIMTPTLKIRLTKIGLLEEQVFFSEIDRELAIGRDPSRVTLAFPKDELLSSRHCVIRNKAEKITLEDLGSTNGTFVNGVPINGEYKLECDDIILAGSMELRINW